jgi:hypothetical protein
MCNKITLDMKKKEKKGAATMAGGEGGEGRDKKSWEWLLMSFYVNILRQILYLRR